MYEVIKRALVERGWAIDVNAIERPDGELHEFVHPTSCRRMAYLDAIHAEMDRELERADKDLL